MREACRQARVWADAGHTLVAGLNVAGQHLRRPGLVDTVRTALAASGADPRRLEIEITESAFLQNADEAIQAFSRLRELGVRISIDDFGTGYSSLIAQARQA